MRGNHEQSTNIPNHSPSTSRIRPASRSSSRTTTIRNTTTRCSSISLAICSTNRIQRKAMSQLKAAKFSMDTRVTVKTIILKLLELSPMTDPELCQAYRNMSYIGQAPTSSDQNIRTHRAQLHRLGLVQVVGTTKTDSGREARIWRKL